MLSRRKLLGGFLAAGGLAGCESNSNSTMMLVVKSVASPSVPRGAYPLSEAQIHELPYATLGVQVGEGQKAVMVLANQDGRNLKWVAADGVVFVTNGGRLLSTQGLPRNLLETRWLEEAGDPLRSVAPPDAVPARGVYREVDLNHEQAIAVESRFEFRREETITILGRERPTLRVDETAIVRAWRWETRNSFWIDPQSGRVWRSIQQYCPEVPPIKLETLKPASV